MNNEIVRALRIPSPYHHEEKKGVIFVAAITRWGNWVDVIETIDGGEADALAKLAAPAREIGELRCEPALAEAGRQSGWIAQEAANQEATRALACYALLLGGETERYPLRLAEKFAEIAASYLERKPWKDPGLHRGFRLRATTRVIDPDEPRPDPPAEEFLALGFPPLDGESQLAFLRNGAPAIGVWFSTQRPVSLVEEWLAHRGLAGILPIAQRSGTAHEMPRPLADVDLVTTMALMNTVAFGANRGRIEGVRLVMGDIDVSTDWLGASRPATRARRPGRNDACHCGSGKKYKKCHLLADELAAAGDARVRSRPLGNGSAELIVSTDGAPVPDGGYDDCPICQAEKEAERLRRMRETPGGTVH